MNKHNYTNYNKPQVMSEPTPDAENVVAPEVLEEIEEINPAELIPVKDVIEEFISAELDETPVAPLDGVVTAAKLNVRKLPSANAAVVTILNQDAKVQIDTEASTADWYKVYTATGIDGYCMKKFITVK